jgi:uncharacterized protein (DUF934 family)
MLIKGGRIVDDIFANVGDGVGLPPGAVVVSLKRFQAERDALLSRRSPLGVRLEPNESPAAIGQDLHRLAVVVLHIPHFKDGRAFSWARLLRTRLGYKGEVRISGHFLRDQLAFLTRVGADAFEMTQNISPGEIETALNEISDVYQPSVDGRATINELRARAH